MILLCSEVKPEEFTKVSSLKTVVHAINTCLASQGKGYLSRDMQMWEAIDETIDLKDCDVYSFVPDPDSDPFGPSM